MEASLEVRELQADDISLIADYWLTSDPDFLVSMGVDLQKLPSREGLTNMLTSQLKTPMSEKMAYALIWLVDGKPVGHCNVNGIEFGQSAFMHLHLWQPETRQRGMGKELVIKSLPYFFDNLQLQELYSEPYALNAAPNKTLEKVGFTFEKRYVTIPGSLNFEQEVNRWKLTRKDYQKIISETHS
ncbi:GNAT family N-acetyltransferase [Nibribacter ruber]|uniref:GNAT family N-acetyltransferase n=1 Tax=Nibribacter ruber TaxID=2698458 RepID=A0A6P1P161_9BACT|nr:GNAT family protein [Nibribacter ruber]QHL88181.1 GNAT family N-acetyltransferase [Nibribacter ruber]